MQSFLAVFIIIIICTVSSAIVEDAVLLGAEWEEYKTSYNKYYDSLLEEEYRYEQFKQSKLRVAEHNLLYAAGTVTYMMGLNEFSDLSPEEFIEQYTMDISTMPLSDLLDDEQVRMYNVSQQRAVPDSIDWRLKGAITPVKHQGTCGACWAFAAMGALEAHHFIKFRRLIGLSEQNLVDCVVRNGCVSGWPVEALQYVRDNHGVDTERSYPYLAKQGECHFNRKTVGAKVSNIWMLPRNEEVLKTVVGTMGPVAVAINIALRFYNYHGGVYYERHCWTTSVHAVLVVGYGNDPKDGPFWLVKNSWGPRWGEGGYIRIARNRNTCGIVNTCVFPSP